jgi:Flp pilus assembly protein TadG
VTRPRDDDAGNALVEFVFVAVLVMVPLVYVIVAVATVQRSQLAVAQAARQAGRAFATSDTAAAAPVRMRAAVRLALADQGLADDAQLRIVAVGGSCTTGPSVVPRLEPGAVFTVCVSRRVELPAVPSLLEGRGVRTVGAYVVHVDDFRAAAP